MLAVTSGVPQGSTLNRYYFLICNIDYVKCFVTTVYITCSLIEDIWYDGTKRQFPDKNWTESADNWRILVMV